MTVGGLRVFEHLSGFEFCPFRWRIQTPTHRSKRRPLGCLVTSEMNKSLITFSITIILVLSSCSSYTSSIPDDIVLQTIFKNHPPPVFSANDEPPPPARSFEEFSKNLIYKRDDVDINSDGKKEILLSGSTSFPNWAFFIIYKGKNKQELQELYYSDAVGWYSASAQFRAELPYVFADFLTTSGGTGYFSYSSERNIVRCTASRCASVPYRYFSGDTVGDYHSSSANISESQIEVEVNGFYVESEPVTETVCDPTGKEYSIAGANKHYYVDTGYYHKYLWKDNHFLETGYQETPAFEVSSFYDGPYTGIIPSVIRESETPDATIQQTLDAYFDFFGATADERKSPPTVPCNKVNKDSNWLPYSIPTTVYKMKDQDYFAAVNNSCKLVVWKKNADILEPKFSDLQIIGRARLADCNPDFISFQWINFTGNDIPELIVTSSISKQTIWIYDVSQSVKLIYQITGFSRENPMIGVQLQKTSDDITLKVGLPRDNGRCLDAFDCFSLALYKEFETFRWNNDKQTFVATP